MAWKLRFTPFEDDLHFNEIFARYFGNSTTDPTNPWLKGSTYANTSDMKLYRWNGSAWVAIYDLIEILSNLLLETGDNLLLETGDKLLLE